MSRRRNVTEVCGAPITDKETRDASVLTPAAALGAKTELPTREQ